MTKPELSLIGEKAHDPMLKPPGGNGILVVVLCADGGFALVAEGWPENITFSVLWSRKS